MFTEPVSSWTMSLKRRASYMLLPAVIWWFGNVALEHVSTGKVAICIQCPPVGACGPVRARGYLSPEEMHLRRRSRIFRPSWQQCIHVII